MIATNPEGLTPAIDPLQPPRDLDKERDDRCYPVVYGILSDMVEGLVPEDASSDTKALELKTLQRTLDANLNIALDNPYVFQLILGVFSAFNATIAQCATVPIDRTRYAGIARKMLAILNEAHPRLNPPQESDVEADFAPIKEKINALFAEEKLNGLEVQYIIGALLQAFKNLQEGFMLSVEGSSKRAEARVFGVEDMTDLTMADLDRVLRS